MLSESWKLPFDWSLGKVVRTESRMELPQILHAMGRSAIRTLSCLLYSVNRRISNGKDLPVLTLYTKHDCQLCDEAMAVLKPYRHRFHLQEVDIKNKVNKDWFNKYRYDIPVFHFNGQFLMKHRVDLSVFEEALKKYEDKDS